MVGVDTVPSPTVRRIAGDGLSHNAVARAQGTAVRCAGVRAWQPAITRM